MYADSAMYRGKRAGRTTVTIADPALNGEHVDEQKRAELSNALAQVIADRSLRPVYQPVVHLETGRIIGYEGLIRPTPDTPFANPGALFAAAEISGHVVDLNLACLAVVLAGARAIPDPLLLTLNVSPRTLEAPEFGAARLLRMVAAAGLPPDRVILEITERDVINDVPRVLAALEGCRAGGIRIAADDVGAGNAGLRLLSQFRFDVVKIDLSLVQAGTGQETVRSVLGTLVDLAGRWGALLVAEGIETPAQLALVRELAIRAGQGYLLGDRARPSTSTRWTSRRSCSPRRTRTSGWGSTASRSRAARTARSAHPRGSCPSRRHGRGPRPQPRSPARSRTPSEAPASAAAPNAGLRVDSGRRTAGPPTAPARAPVPYKGPLSCSARFPDPPHMALPDPRMAVESRCGVSSPGWSFAA